MTPEPVQVGKRFELERVHDSCAGLGEALREGDSWEKIENHFRIWSFRVYYNKCYATQRDMTWRFVSALATSCKPIRDRRLVYAWHREQIKLARTGKRNKSDD